jgi:amino acid permease
MTYFNSVCNNNYLLSIILACICVIIVYFENKMSNKINSNIYYIKLLVLITVAVYSGIYLNNTNIVNIKQAENVNVNIGEPSF